MGDYIAIVILVGLAAVICGAMVSLSFVLGPKNTTPYKQSPYECGVQPLGDARERFPIKFYLVAMLFILFDIEVVFLWSWLTVFKNADLAYQTFSFGAVMVYMVLWIIGDAYVIRVNAIDWDETTSLHPAKLGEPDPAALPVTARDLELVGGAR
ncbi:MAG: NADH-quinone oxidoreductase subunit A [Fimbriimonadaceae bacterium]|nr:NADH-quinone oxidoreductase subunit A [Fimbriimonadaceae bacterium]